MSPRSRTLSILLVEPNAMLRQTVAMTTRSAGLADVHEASSIAGARKSLMNNSFDGVLMALDKEGTALDLIELLRAGRTFSQPGTAVAVMVEQCDSVLAHRLKVLSVQHVLLQPFRVRNLIVAIQTIAARNKGR